MTAAVFGLLVPDIEGDEGVAIAPDTGATAYAGTGFNQSNPQHSTGPDAVHYAIAIQQHRDRRDYKAADAARGVAERRCLVKQQANSTTVFSAPHDYPPHNQMCVSGGILYDLEGRCR